VQWWWGGDITDWYDVGDADAIYAEADKRSTIEWVPGSGGQKGHLQLKDADTLGAEGFHGRMSVPMCQWNAGGGGELVWREIDSTTPTPETSPSRSIDEGDVSGLGIEVYGFGGGEKNTVPYKHFHGIGAETSWHKPVRWEGNDDGSNYAVEAVYARETSGVGTVAFELEYDRRSMEIEDCRWNISVPTTMGPIQVNLTGAIQDLIDAALEADDCCPCDPPSLNPWDPEDPWNIWLCEAVENCDWFGEWTHPPLLDPWDPEDAWNIWLCEGVENCDWFGEWMTEALCDARYLLKTDGVDGSFTTADSPAKTVTVVDGQITSIV
jgi:hypothetical protein